MALERHCGPWRDTWLGRVRHCNNPLLPEAATLEIERTPEPEPEPEADVTPALPPVKEPPAVERVVITERTTKIARKLIESVFTEGATS